MAIWSDGETMWVTDYQVFGDDKLYAYDLESKRPFPAGTSTP